ncbi:galactokinase [Nitrospira sp. Nam74]
MPDFKAVFRRRSEFEASAPGRVNLMGDHTDYNGGYVLPTVIPQRTRAELALRTDQTVHVWSGNVAAVQSSHTYELGTEARQGAWVDYVQGVTHLLGQERQRLTGFDLTLQSTVPLGAGLSSSASLLVAVFRVLREAMGLTLTDADIARLAHRAETDFVGAPVGVMDQMVCALGMAGRALLLDTMSLRYEHIPLPLAAEWIIIHSGVDHSHATGSYRQRREECEEASRLLGISHLRALEGEPRQRTLARIESLPERLGRRARHVVTENDRVLIGVRCLEARDAEKFGQLMYASHESLRRDYEVSTDEIDALVDLARAEPDVYGARLTGGGFGGSVVMAARADTASGIAPRIARAYRERCGRVPTVLLPTNVHQRERNSLRKVNT